MPVPRAPVREVYGFVNNHFAGHGPASVRMLMVDPRAIGDPPSPF